MKNQVLFVLTLTCMPRQLDEKYCNRSNNILGCFYRSSSLNDLAFFQAEGTRGGEQCLGAFFPLAIFLQKSSRKLWKPCAFLKFLPDYLPRHSKPYRSRGKVPLLELHPFLRNYDLMNYARNLLCKCFCLLAVFCFFLFPLSLVSFCSVFCNRNHGENICV